MKTVQEYFRKADADKLINYYLHKHPVKLEDITQDNEKILDAKNRIRKRLQEYIERLRSMDIEDGEDGKEYILFVHKMQQDGAEEDTASLVCRQELRDKGLEAETYSYVFDRQAKIMGFKVSDAAYTQKNLIELLTDVMYEASFFGFEQQHLDEELQKLEFSIKEFEEGTATTYTMEEVWEHFGFEKEERDETADELWHAITRAVVEYNQYQKKKELQALMDSLEL
jgi:hypothetical protein